MLIGLLDTATFKMDNCEFSSNKAYTTSGLGYGGAIFFNLDTMEKGVITIGSNVTFSQNRAQIGGAIYFTSAPLDASITINSSTFTSNFATKAGHIIYTDISNSQATGTGSRTITMNSITVMQGTPSDYLPIFESTPSFFLKGFDTIVISASKFDSSVPLFEI